MDLLALIHGALLAVGTSVQWFTSPSSYRSYGFYWSSSPTRARMLRVAACCARRGQHPRPRSPVPSLLLLLRQPRGLEGTGLLERALPLNQMRDCSNLVAIAQPRVGTCQLRLAPLKLAGDGGGGGSWKREKTTLM